MEDRSWLDLPLELLETILSKLPLSDHPKFACVCKDWKKLTSPVYPADKSPLLAYFKKWRDGDLRYYSPLLNKSFKVDFPADLSKARLYSCKDGWLALCREEEVLLVNPLTETVRKFPGLVYTPSFNGIEFIGQPPDDKCCIFAIESVCEDEVLIYFWNGEDWGRDTYANNVPFVMAPHSNPVCLGEYFVCLGEDGNIGAYDMFEDKWIILEFKNFPTAVGGSYLVEGRDNIRAITVGSQNSAVKILELIPEGWIEVTDLKTLTLFIGPRMPLISTNLPKKMDNIVFFSRLLGTPEEIEAEIRCSEGQTYFVPRKSTGLKKTGEGGMYTCNLMTGSSSEYRGSLEYPCSIWYEPRVLENV